MNTMNLNAAGVMELSAVEMGAVEGGGFIDKAIKIAIEVIENWDECVEAFKRGLNDGYNSVK